MTSSRPNVKPRSVKGATERDLCFLVPRIDFDHAHVNPEAGRCLSDFTGLYIREHKLQRCNGKAEVVSQASAKLLRSFDFHQNRYDADTFTRQTEAS